MIENLDVFDFELAPAEFQHRERASSAAAGSAATADREWA